jgi:ATP-dependent helicase Lhr and Lhr-like helicase
VAPLPLMRETAAEISILVLSATDPANPYGAALPWPQRNDNRLPGRAAGAQVILINGELTAFLSRAEKSLLTFLPKEESLAAKYHAGIAKVLADLIRLGKRRALYLTEIDGEPPEKSALAQALLREGFVAYPGGWQFKIRNAEGNLTQSTQ